MSAPMTRQTWRGARIFDGTALVPAGQLVTEAGRIVAILPPGSPAEGQVHELDGGILAPGFVDLQVNGGGGRLLGQGDPDAEIAAICATHAALGTTGLLPTLITADPDITRAVLAAGLRAARAGLPGFLGLHLEGPFLDPRRKGAHEASLFRALTDDDLAELIGAAQNLPALMVTLAPEAARPSQIAALTAGGVVVALGHSDCAEEPARAAFDAGASCVTHLYNAMSPLTHRAPGLVGAALDAPVWAGIIPDGVHVAKAAFRIALAAKPGRVFAVSDAMAVAGTSAQEFLLNGRVIRRSEGRLTLADGTLAGADVSLPQGLAWMVRTAGVPLAEALAMVTSRPARVLGLTDRGVLVPGARADLVHLDDDLRVRAVWAA